MLTALLVLCLAGTPTPGADAGAGSAPARAGAPTPGADAGVGPSPDLATFIRQPERVRIFLADMDLGMPPRQSGRKIVPSPRAGPFLLPREGPALQEADRQRLGQSWVSPRDVVPEEPLRCAFNPDVALRFQRGAAWVDAVVCFGCSEVWFFDAKGEALDGGDFRDFELLLRLARQAFPKEQLGRD